MIIQLHSYWAYFTLGLLITSFIVFKYSWLLKKPFKNIHLRIGLFTLIASHIQLILGLILYFTSPAFNFLRQNGMGATMKQSYYRLLMGEHPIMMLLAITLITIGFSKHKNKKTDNKKFKILTLFYGIALISVLSRIPWQQWF